jgi:voltage-dependent calcium channel T type alpha-1G
LETTTGDGSHVKATFKGDIVVDQEDEDVMGEPTYPPGFRGQVAKFVDRKEFDNFILMCIMVSSLCMAFDDPLKSPDHLQSQILLALNFIFTGIFLTELILKHIAVGIKEYWGNSWNILDGGVVIVAVVDLLLYLYLGPGQNQYAFLKALRILRALRPLRVIARNPNLKLVVNTLFA